MNETINKTIKSLMEENLFLIGDLAAVIKQPISYVQECFTGAGTFTMQEVVDISKWLAVPLSRLMFTAEVNHLG